MATGNIPSSEQGFFMKHDEAEKMAHRIHQLQGIVQAIGEGGSSMAEGKLLDACWGVEEMLEGLGAMLNDARKRAMATREAQA